MIVKAVLIEAAGEFQYQYIGWICFAHSHVVTVYKHQTPCTSLKRESKINIMYYIIPLSLTYKPIFVHFFPSGSSILEY